MFCSNKFEITSSKKVRTKRKEVTKKRNSLDLLSNLKIKTSVELVRTCVLAKYLEYDRRKIPLPDSSKRYIKDLGNDIKQNGLKNTIILAISKKRASIGIWGKSSYGCLVRQQCWLGTFDGELLFLGLRWCYPPLPCTSNSKWKLLV